MRLRMFMVALACASVAEGLRTALGLNDPGEFARPVGHKAGRLDLEPLAANSRAGPLIYPRAELAGR